MDTFITRARRALTPVLEWPALPDVSFWIVLVLFLSSTARWTWVLFTPTAPIPPAVSPRPESRALLNLSELFSAQLFGRSAGATGMDASSEAPVSGLHLLLTGIVMAGQNSLALISVSGEPPQPYAIGQEIMGGITLDSVYADYVLIKRNGASESLLLGGDAAPRALISPGL